MSLPRYLSETHVREMLPVERGLFGQQELRRVVGLRLGRRLAEERERRLSIDQSLDQPSQRPALAVERHRVAGQQQRPSKRNLGRNQPPLCHKLLHPPVRLPLLLIVDEPLIALPPSGAPLLGMVRV